MKKVLLIAALMTMSSSVFAIGTFVYGNGKTGGPCHNLPGGDISAYEGSGSSGTWVRRDYGSCVGKFDSSDKKELPKLPATKEGGRLDIGRDRPMESVS